uniref:Uncharacterized protein n=1 Tax=Anguilla anguilla TaxID=7936 RepID=A0A0E9QDA7_ANGAN
MSVVESTGCKLTPVTGHRQDILRTRRAQTPKRQGFK